MARVIETEVAPSDGVISYNPLVRVVYAIAAIIETLLIVRLIFRALGANPLNGFVHWIYSVTEPLVSPFFNLFNSSITATLSQAHLEVPTLVAIAVYALIAWLLAMLFSAIMPRRV